MRVRATIGIMTRLGISLLIVLNFSACATTDLTVHRFESQCSESIKDGRDHLPYFRAPPTYPWKALSQGIEGYAHFEFDLSTEGRPINIKLIESYPTDIFVRAGYESLQVYKYKPVVKNGQAVVSRCHAARIAFAIAE